MCTVLTRTTLWRKNVNTEKSVSAEAQLEAGETPSKKKRRTGYSHNFRIAHWVLALSMPVLLYSGICIHSIARPDWSLIGRFPTFFPGGRVILWHQVAGLFFAPAAVIAAIVFFRRHSLSRLRGLRRIVNVVLLVVGLGSVISMLPLIYPGGPSGLYHIARFIHAICGMVILPVALLIHCVLAFTRYRALLVPVFAPLRQSQWLGVFWFPAGIAVAFLMTSQAISRRTAGHTLEAARIAEQVSDIDGVRALPWDSARPLELRLVNGHGFDRGTSRMTLKSMYNDTHLFIVAKWDNPTEDRRYWPWKRTEQGWEHLVSEPTDETIYYEDKFSLIFPVDRDPAFSTFGCSVYCHAHGDFRYGYKAASSKVDVWHWKATRTDPMGYVDDKYWLGHDLEAKNVGRFADPKEGNGSAKNNSEDKTRPMMLPVGDDAEFNGALLRSKATEYTEEAAEAIPPGALVPGIVVEPIAGDRGDVVCSSLYENGTWTLYIMRALDTGSGNDTVFAPGGRYDFSAAAFDHCAKRHAYNAQVYRLWLKQ